VLLSQQHFKRRNDAHPLSGLYFSHYVNERPVSGVNKKHLIVSVKSYVRTELESSSDVIIKTKTKQ